MAEAKVKKMSQAFDPATGTLTFSFPELEPLAYRLSEFPENVIAFWTAFGMKTAGRNASIGSDEDGSVGSPETMRARVAAKFAQWQAGVLRLATAGEEKAAVAPLLLEAAAIFKRMKAAIEAGADVDTWRDFEGPAPEELRAEFEALDDVVTNQPEVDAARAKAEAAGEDGDEAAKKATLTRLDILKASTLFKLAYGEADAARKAAKKLALKTKLAAEAAAG